MIQRLKQVLVIYATSSGCTATIARRIADDLIGFAANPTVVSMIEMPSINKDFDAVIFGSGMRLGKWHKEARVWMQNNFDYLVRVPVACFSVGLLSANEHESAQAQAQRELESQVSATGGIHPVGMVALPGWKRNEGFTKMEQIALRVYPLGDGDYRDWDKVDEWVLQVTPKLIGNLPQVNNSLGSLI
ncbi:MAG: hypothetical protein IKE43_00380 [Coriobacteriales bacterium]|nr:hypothetical protein [Coriobacteriales bacterium]